MQFSKIFIAIFAGGAVAAPSIIEGRQDTRCNLCRDECLALVQVDKCINTCNKDLNCRIGQFDRGDNRNQNNGRPQNQ